MAFEKSAKYLPACGGTQASKIPTEKAELERNNEVIIKIPLEDLFYMEMDK